MIPRRSGSIINIGSISGMAGHPLRSPYAVSKWGIIGLTETLSIEVGQHNIRVNCVSPGLIHADGLEEAWPAGVARWHAAAPLRRLGEPRDIADAVLFLASDAARWITGANLVVDGGVLTRSTW